MGAARSSRLVGLQVQHRPKGKIVVLQLETTFDGGIASESFAWRADSGSLRLLSYTAQSPVLASP
jgi:hypothetical protein